MNINILIQVGKPMIVGFEEGVIREFKIGAIVTTQHGFILHAPDFQMLVRRKEFVMLKPELETDKVPDQLKSNDEIQIPVARIYFKKTSELHPNHKSKGVKQQVKEYYLYFQYMISEDIDPMQALRYWHINADVDHEMRGGRPEYMNPLS